MLRDYVHTLSPLLIVECLQQFEMDNPVEDVSISLIAFQMMSAEQLLWKFVIENEIYYLYCLEDVTTREAVEEGIYTHIGIRPELEFIPIKERPRSLSYRNPRLAPEDDESRDYDELKEISADDEVDFVFLLRSDESYAEALYGYADIP